MAGGVVARTGVDIERRKAFGWAQLDFDLPPAGIVIFVARPISQYVLIAQFHSDLGRNVRKVVEVLHRKDAASGHVRDLGEQRGPIQFLERPIAITKRLENADGINLRRPARRLRSTACIRNAP